MKRFSSWTHGCSIPNARAYGEIGAIMHVPSGEKPLKIRIPIPTPVIVADRRATLERVVFLFSADPFPDSPGDSQLRGVDIHDGARLIRRIDGIAVGGDHSQVIDDQNSVSIPLPLPQLMSGLLVTLRVGLISIGGEFLVAAVGAEFLVDV